MAVLTNTFTTKQLISQPLSNPGPPNPSGRNLSSGSLATATKPPIALVRK
jgi:hypothetical protein